MDDQAIASHRFPPSREAGLTRLAGFLPKAGRAYAKGRNYDLPHQGHPYVSGLSPYVRHRLITEEEVLRTTLGRHALSSAEKFVQEVYWRTYWKGWLEMRPQVWDWYREGVRRGLDRVATESGLRRDWEAACRGETGIDCFDHWAHELADTGYMHNHARMWFASIWVFTLSLPWELGADFFVRHLLDGDPASNTLSWRWVAGLQTRGKTYLARPDNIARYTEGRLTPEGQLARSAPALDGPEHPPRMAPPVPRPIPSEPATAWLLTEEDLMPGYMLPDDGGPVAIVTSAEGRSPLATAKAVLAFTAGAAEDTRARLAARFDVAPVIAGEGRIAAALDWIAATGAAQVVTPYAPVGPAAATLRQIEQALAAWEIPLHRALRPYDAESWPHATAGFFKFKEKIPRLLAGLKGLNAA